MVEIWYPKDDYIEKNIDTHSWFDIKQQKSIHKYEKLNFNDTPTDHEHVIRMHRINLYPNGRQKEILLKWIELYRQMYNETINFINTNKYYCVEQNMYKLLNFNDLRDIHLKNDKKKLTQAKIPSHTLDGAIKDVCKAYKSAFANLFGKNIKHFMVRYKKQKCPKQTITLEASVFSKEYNTFCKNSLGNEMKCNYDLKSITKDCRLQYDFRTKRFYLFIPRQLDSKTSASNNTESCGIDPGMRTMFTLYSSNRVEHIGTNAQPFIKKTLNQISSIYKRNDLKKGRIRRAAKKRYIKIENKIDDFSRIVMFLPCKNIINRV